MKNKLPLADAKEGSDVEISCVDCGRCLKQRLCDLGLYDGTKINIIKNDIRGPIIIKVKDSTLALGRGEAKQISVSAYG